MLKTAIDPSLARVANDPTRFSGMVRTQVLRDTAEGIRVQAVYFSPSARTRPHIHLNDQVLHCIEGEGVVAAVRDDGVVEAVRIRPNDIVVIPKNTWHWHGATKDSWMAHIAIHVHDQGDHWEGVDQKDWALYAGG